MIVSVYSCEAISVFAQIAKNNNARAKTICVRYTKILRSRLFWWAMQRPPSVTINSRVEVTVAIIRWGMKNHGACTKPCSWVNKSNEKNTLNYRRKTLVWLAMKVCEMNIAHQVFLDMAVTYFSFFVECLIVMIVRTFCFFLRRKRLYGTCGTGCFC